MLHFAFHSFSPVVCPPSFTTAAARVTLRHWAAAMVILQRAAIREAPLCCIHYSWLTLADELWAVNVLSNFSVCHKQHHTAFKACWFISASVPCERYFLYWLAQQMMYKNAYKEPGHQLQASDKIKALFLSKHMIVTIVYKTELAAVTSLFGFFQSSKSFLVPFCFQSSPYLDEMAQHPCY